MGLKKFDKCGCGNKTVAKMVVAGVKRLVCSYCRKFYLSLPPQEDEKRKAKEQQRRAAAYEKRKAGGWLHG